MSRKYVFENIDGTLLKKELLDSFRFIEFCEIENAALLEDSMNVDTASGKVIESI